MAKNTIVIFVSDHREYACCQVSLIVANGLWPIPAWN